MKVKLQYDVELEEMPHHIRDLFFHAEREYEKIVALQKKITLAHLEKDQWFGCSLMVDKLRQRLAIYDMKLQNCYNVLSGYQKTMLSIEKQQEIIEE